MNHHSRGKILLHLETAVEESEVSPVAYAFLLFSSVKERKCFHSGN